MRTWFLTASIAACSIFFATPDGLSQSPTLYHDIAPIKIHLTVNQEGYFPGDTLFFKAVVRPVTPVAPAKIRTIVHVLLKEANGRIVQRQAVRVENGEASNQLMLSPSLTPGRYQLVAYNDWLEKYNLTSAFQQWIYVGDSPKKTIESGVVTKGFYPEGGNFLTGIDQKIVVTGPPHATGTITNGTETVATFRVDRFGLGSFILNRTSAQYDAIFNDGSKVSLPVAATDGFAIKVEEVLKNSMLKATLSVPANSSLRSQKLTFFVTSAGRVFLSGDLQMNEKASLAIDLPLVNLPSGIACFSLVDQQQKILAERLFFVADRAPAEAQINLPSRNFGTRQKVTASISVRAFGVAQQGKMAVSVYSNDVAPGEATDKNIVSNFLLYHGLAGKFTSQQNIFANDSTGSIDRMLITQQWKRPFRNVSDANTTAQSFLSRLHLKGKATRLSGDAIPDSAKVTFLLQNSVSVYYTYIKDGRYDASLWMDFFGDETVFYRVSLKDQVLEDVRLTPDDDERPRLKAVAGNEDLNSFVAKRNSINRSFEYFRLNGAVAAVADPNKEFENEIFSPDAEVRFSDYVLFPTMEETLREVVKFVQHRTVKGKGIVRVMIRRGDFKKFADTKPLYVIDGVVTDDTDLFLSLKPSEVQRLQIINVWEKLQMFGELGRGGIILVETKIPDFALTMSKPETAFTVKGLSEPVVFKPSRYNDSNTRVPDLRTTLFWSPEVVTNESGEAVLTFYTNDIAGSFILKVEGITDNGQPLYAEQPFNVSFRP